MIKILAVFALGLSLIWATPVSAQSFQDHIIRELTEHGYTRFHVHRTLLGRTRIVAEGEGRTREIIFNPSTGEILRDVWVLDPAEDDPLIGHEDDREDRDDDDH